VISPAVAAGRNVVLMGEEWHTAASMNLISDSLYFRGLRDRVVMLWNANNTFGFHRINWGALAFAVTMTTVSRYMKFKMWESGQNPMVIPNGIRRSSIQDADPEAVAELRAAAAADHFCFKIGRFDPDKRWLMAICRHRLPEAPQPAGAPGDARWARGARRRGLRARAAPGLERDRRQRSQRAIGAVGDSSPEPRSRRHQPDELRQRTDGRGHLLRMRRGACQLRARAVRGSSDSR